MPAQPPASEIETKVIVDLIENFQPQLILALHQPYGLINYDGPALMYAQLMAKLNHYPVSEDIGYATPGSLGSYAGKDKNIPVITLELHENEPDEKLWRDNNLAIIAAINHT